MNINSNTIVTWCDRIIMGGIFVIAFLVPLYIDGNISECFALAKVLLMYALTAILLIVWLIKMVIINDFRSIRTPLDFPILAFLIVNILATVFSIAPIISLLGLYNRNDGLLSLICYIIQYYMVVNFFKTKSSVVWLLSIIVCVGGISGVYGIIQQLDICPAAWMPNDLYRVSSFFGNPVFYAAYTMMAFLIGMGLYLFSGCERIERSDSDRKGLRGTPWLSIFWGICLLVIFCGFCLANTRGCYLGLFGGVITFFCLAGKELLSKYRIRLIIISLGIFIIYGWYNIITTEYSVLKRFS
ncbi:MAG: hypothetical protein AAB296_05110, partial [Candidatus Desantisbacteria bacterium]